MTREEMVSAYLDGALNADESAEVEALIASDPAFAEMVARLRDNDRLLHAALTAAVPEVADAATLRRFGIAPAATAPAAKPSATAPSAKPAANDNLRRWLWPGALTAIAASAAVVMLGQPRQVQAPWQTAQFAAALERTPSLQAASLPDDASVSPSLSFAAGDGRFCREFKLTAKAAAQSRDGIACRGAGGEWQAVALIAPAGSRPTGNSIEVAAGADGGALDPAYRRLAASDPLGAERERELIASHWQKKK